MTDYWLGRVESLGESLFRLTFADSAGDVVHYEFTIEPLDEAIAQIVPSAEFTGACTARDLEKSWLNPVIGRFATPRHLGVRPVSLAPSGKSGYRYTLSAGDGRIVELQLTVSRHPADPQDVVLEAQAEDLIAMVAAPGDRAGLAAAVQYAVSFFDHQRCTPLTLEPGTRV